MDPELNGRKGVMVCVTGQRSCEILHGEEMLDFAKILLLELR